ncbi:MAG: Kelch repeat-containing protein [Myxococcota bacterium]
MNRAHRLSLAVSLTALACESPESSVRSVSQPLESVRWQRLDTPTSPPARMGHVMVYDSLRRATVVAGGRPVSDSGASLSDTWLWDGSAWLPGSQGFPRRGFISGVFDSSRQAVLTYGGFDLSGYYDDTWSFGSGTWTASNATGPSARSSYGISYDSQRGVSVLFGGYNVTWSNDIWEWSNGSWAPKCTDSVCANAVHPARRAGPVFVYDEARAVTLMFGGYGDNRMYGDTWTWNGTSWKQLQPSHSPAARASAAAAYDPLTRRVYVFGGATAGDPLNDLWAWDGVDWHPLALTTPAAARREAAMVWDTTRRRGVVFGGRYANRQVDAWEFSLIGNSCSSDDECHSLRCDDSVCVDDVASSGGAANTGSGGVASSGSGGVASSSGGATTGGAPAKGGAANGGSAMGDAGSFAQAGAGAGGSATGGIAAAFGGTSGAPLGAASDARSLYGCGISRRARSNATSWTWFVALAFVGLRRRRSAV